MYLVQLIYASTAIDLNKKDIDDILHTAQSHNQSKMITGALCFNHNRFLQCLEGGRSAVNRLYSKIAADPRHKDVLLLDYRTTNERMFSEWSMAYFPADKLHRDMIKSFSHQDEFDPYQFTGESTYRMLQNLNKSLRYTS